MKISDNYVMKFYIFSRMANVKLKISEDSVMSVDYSCDSTLLLTNNIYNIDCVPVNDFHVNCKTLEFI